jgi:hypothetical protein
MLEAFIIPATIQKDEGWVMQNNKNICKLFYMCANRDFLLKKTHKWQLE